jgi:hypothetical protein
MRTKQLGEALKEAPFAEFCLLSPEHRGPPSDGVDQRSGPLHREAQRGSSFRRLYTVCYRCIEALSILPCVTRFG